MHTTARMTNRRLAFFFPPEPIDGAQPGNGGAGGGTGSDDKVFTQADVERLAAREKDQGRRSATKEFATSLGFEKPEDLQAFIEAKRQADEAALTEQQRREREIQQREAAAAQREREAAATVLASKKALALTRAGATGDDLDDALALLRIADDASDDDIKTAAEALKTRRPEMFGGGTQQQQRVTQPSGGIGGTGPQGAAAGGQRQAPGALGSAYADRRFGKRETATTTA